MKIYCATSQPELDQYVGKDVWIKCHGYGNGITWVRILKSVYWDNKFAFYYINKISDHYLQQLLNPNDYTVIHLDNNHIPVETERCRELDIIEPITVKTTQELFELPEYAVDSSTSDLFDQFAGTNIWLRATRGAGSYDDYYIRISEKIGNTIVYDKIDAYFVEDPTNVDTSGGPPSECTEIYNTDEVSHIDAWKISDPADVLTTDEVDEAYNTGEEYWWDYYNNHYDEFHDEDEEE